MPIELTSKDIWNIFKIIFTVIIIAILSIPDINLDDTVYKYGENYLIIQKVEFVYLFGLYKNKRDDIILVSGSDCFELPSYKQIIMYDFEQKIKSAELYGRVKQISSEEFHKLIGAK